MDDRLTFREAARLLPERPAIGRLRRWALVGVRVGSEVVVLPSDDGRHVRLQDLQRFVALVGQRRVPRFKSRGRHRRGKKWRARQHRALQRRVA
jgi:hypothetical protein